MGVIDDMFSIVSSDAQRTVVELHADHLVFQAHFPGNPIMPGVCIVHMISRLTEKRVGHSLVLHKVVNLKFIAPISPASEPVLTIDFSAIDLAETEVKVRGIISAGERIVTKFSIIYKK